MKRQEGACCWHDQGVFKAQANIAQAIQARGPTGELQAQQQRLRQAVVDPEGYRTFETCHFRLRPKPNSRPTPHPGFFPDPSTTGALKRFQGYTNTLGPASVGVCWS